LPIFNPKCGTIVVPKVELRKVTVQMLLSAMLVNAHYATLEEAEVTFDAIRRRIAASVLLRSVANALGDF
jgi:hypothetical protein